MAKTSGCAKLADVVRPVSFVPEDAVGEAARTNPERHRCELSAHVFQDRAMPHVSSEGKPDAITWVPALRCLKTPQDLTDLKTTAAALHTNTEPSRTGCNSSIDDGMP